PHCWVQYVSGSSPRALTWPARPDSVVCPNMNRMCAALVSALGMVMGSISSPEFICRMTLLTIVSLLRVSVFITLGSVIGDLVAQCMEPNREVQFKKT